jgi:mannose-1-phosphate guanylyltransferase
MTFTGTTRSCRPSSWAIVLAGGSGKRLETLTRELFGVPVPRQFCSFGGGRSLLQETIRQIRPLFGASRTLVVANSSHRAVASRELQAAGGGVLVEQPSDRGTAPGVLLPLMHVLERDPDATVTLFPSDHGIGDSALFNRGLWWARTAVEESSSLVVVGAVQATTPETDYGWIVPEEMATGPDGLALQRIVRFVEKPAAEEARQLLATGALWSTLVVVAKASTLFELCRQHLGSVTEFFQEYAGRSRKSREAWLKKNYATLPVTNFSRELLAAAASLWALVWPERLAWTDLGTPNRLVRWLDRRRCGSVLT